MKKISIRNLIIVLLCFTIICMAIGFSILSSKLEALKNKKEIFNVVFTDIKEETLVKGGIKNPTCEHIIEDDGHTVDMKFTMFNQLDEASYTITIENKGTMKAKVIDVVSSPDYMDNNTSKNSIAPVSITVPDISGKVLEPAEETTIKVIATYNKSATNKTIIIPYKLSLIAASNN